MTAVSADVLVLRFLRRSVPHVAYSYHTLHRISARLQMSACWHFVPSSVFHVSVACRL